MQLSDFFIGKPGPGCISEAIQQGLPVLVVNNTWTMPQERYNAVWVEENRVGVVLESFKLVRRGVADIIARLPQLRANVARIQNRAIFEIPDILDGILSQGVPDQYRGEAFNQQRNRSIIPATNHARIGPLLNSSPTGAPPPPTAYASLSISRASNPRNTTSISTPASSAATPS